MKDMTEMDELICETQQEIYEYMSNLGYDMTILSEAYLCSDFCAREMDTLYSEFFAEFPKACSNFFMPEIENKLKKSDGNPINNRLVAGTVGFMYRYLYLETSVPSKELAKLIPYEEMAGWVTSIMHESYESVLEEIMERYNLVPNRYDKEITSMTEEEKKQLVERLMRE